MPILSRPERSEAEREAAAKLGAPLILDAAVPRATDWEVCERFYPLVKEQPALSDPCSSNAVLTRPGYLRAVSDTVSFKPDEAIAWPEIQASVNAWRGRCLKAFARAEHAVTETLDRLSQDPERGASVKLPHLVGQRFEALAAAIGGGGPFGEEVRSAFEALQRFRHHDALRAPLCHGLGKISVDQAGRWTLVMRMTSFKARRTERSTCVWEEDEAKRLADLIHADAQRLQARLAAICVANRRTD